MDSYDLFHELLKHEFFPLLRADGFKGSGTTLQRVKGERIDVINVQGAQFGGRCCVNLGVQFSFLPLAGGGTVVDAKKLKEHDCTFRDQLREDTEDRWWNYGTTDTETQVSIASVVDLYQRRCRRFFQRFEPFPDVFNLVKPDQLEAGDLINMPGRMTRVLAALTLARIMKHLGRLDECNEFADVGLRHLARATGLKAELMSLRDATNE